MKNLTKILFVFLLLSSPLFTVAQTLPIDPETNKVVFQEAVETDSINKQQLYERTRQWMIQNFKETKLAQEDSTKGLLVKQADVTILLTYDFKYKNTYIVPFTATIDVKDGKYRYTFDNFTIYDVKNGAKTAQPVETFYSKLRYQSKGEFVNQLTKEVNGLVANLKETASSEVKKTDEEW